MGNSSFNGGIHVQLEKLDFYPGEFMNGTIYISLQEPLMAATQYIAFKGIERTRIRIRRRRTVSSRRRIGGRRRSTTMRTIRQKIITCNFVATVFHWPQGLQPGSYMMPITFKLPENLPGSIKFKSGRNGGSIDYMIEFTLVDNRNRMSRVQAMIFFRQVFDPREHAINIANQHNAPMSTWCCINKGQCMIKASMPKNTYATNEVIDVQIEVDNSQSKLVATHTEIMLIQNIVLRARGRWKIFKNCVGKNQGPGLGAGSGNVPINMSLNLAAFDSSFQGRYSCKGNIITCGYELIVRALMDGSCMCCAQKPEMSLPIIIVPPSFAPPPLPPPPVNWSPHNFDSIQMEYNAAYNNPNAPLAEDDFFKDVANDEEEGGNNDEEEGGDNDEEDGGGDDGD